MNFKNNYNRKTYLEDSDEETEEKIEDRLQKDYEISSNLHTYAKNHESYLCLNKLERIFYYVKKINYSDEYTEEEIF